MNSTNIILHEGICSVKPCALFLIFIFLENAFQSFAKTRTVMSLSNSFEEILAFLIDKSKMEAYAKIARKVD